MATIPHTRELPLLAGRLPSAKAMTIGSLTMVVFALLGNLPMIAGTDILKATTISGTNVIRLAPIFLFSRRVRYSPLSFHLAFWTGITLGILQAINRIPVSWAIGTGKHGILLGTNLYGLMLYIASFFLPLAFPRYRLSSSGSAALTRPDGSVRCAIATDPLPSPRSDRPAPSRRAAHRYR